MSPGAEHAIDRDHLRRMTLGDHALEIEVLRLFDAQAASLTREMCEAESETLSALAHALKGAARGIGAFAVASAAEELERCQDGIERECAFDRLAQAVREARAAIGEILQAA
ncbi:MAG: Hpt domain-containing protein [Pseudolabrys sp.]|nr:Hpt domain-containing protein [Pseudolabrys sp.]MBV9954183.1 Hpt domain-containing protein [Pseudolabrys sp.]